MIGQSLQHVRNPLCLHSAVYMFQIGGRLKAIILLEIEMALPNHEGVDALFMFTMAILINSYLVSHFKAAVE